MANTPPILVVGGAGFIGSHTALALNAAGFPIVIYDNFSNGHRKNCFDFIVEEGDLENTGRLTKVMLDHQIKCVVHFAALIEAGQSVVEPLNFFRNNVAGTVSLLQAMMEADVKNIVFSSTAAVYGDVDTLTLNEELPNAPINPYGQSKAMVETILKSAAAAHGFKAIALRYFNAAGADPKGRTGEMHDPETHLIPLVIQAAKGQRPEIAIFGDDYPTGDGTCIRDYIHVSDLADGHVSAIRAVLDQESEGFDAINLGTGKGYSVRQVVDAVKATSGVDFKVVVRPRRPGDPARLVADVNRAHVKLGWCAKRSQLERIVQDAWNFFNRE